MAMELQENTKRTPLKDQREAKAVFDYFQARKAEEPDFTQEDLGKALGYSQQQISKMFVVAEEMRRPNCDPADSHR
jgi:hypothetical protein